MSKFPDNHVPAAASRGAAESGSVPKAGEQEQSTPTERWQRVDIGQSFAQEEALVAAVAENEGGSRDLRLQCERAASARWVASLFESRTVEISTKNVTMLKECLEMLDNGNEAACYGVVVAAAYIAAETVGSPGENYGHWHGRTLGQEHPDKISRFAALCEERHWIEVSCTPGHMERNEDGEVLLDAKLTALRTGPVSSRITVANGRLVVGAERRIGFVGGIEVTEEADEWLWGEVEDFGMGLEL